VIVIEFGGLGLAVTPEGTPLTEAKVTVPVNPFWGVTVIV
jgi:hypothetical protein